MELDILPFRVRDLIKLKELSLRKLLPCQSLSGLIISKSRQDMSSKDGRSFGSWAQHSLINILRSSIGITSRDGLRPDKIIALNPSKLIDFLDGAISKKGTRNVQMAYNTQPKEYTSDALLDP